ncbi:hypothetical protein J2X68_001697 [Streptomyces sp. 3330]|nr:hypothetical protein [Streptomyces sp. 3330]
MINRNLADPPTVDISQHMGLFVVGRLAERHGIRVQLRPAGEKPGTTSLVMLPGTVTLPLPGALPDSDTLTPALLKNVPRPAYAGATVSPGGQDPGDAFTDYETRQDEPTGTRSPEEPPADRPSADEPSADGRSGDGKSADGPQPTAGARSRRPSRRAPRSSHPPAPRLTAPSPGAWPRAGGGRPAGTRRRMADPAG